MTTIGSAATLFLAALPAHKGSFSLTHNPHKDCYETVVRYAEHAEWDDSDWVSVNEKRLAILNDDFWEAHW